MYTVVMVQIRNKIKIYKYRYKVLNDKDICFLISKNKND